MKDKGLHFGHAEFEVSIHTLVEMSTGVDCAHQELSTNNYTRPWEETINLRSMLDGKRGETRT